MCFKNSKSKSIYQMASFDNQKYQTPCLIMSCGNESNTNMHGNWMIMEDHHHHHKDGTYNNISPSSSSSSSSIGNSVDSSGTLSSSDLADDASSLSSSCSSSLKSNNSNDNGPLFELHELMSQLPIKRGLSKYFNGKSQSFTSLARVQSIEDLAKKETPYSKKMKACKSYGGNLVDAHRSYTTSPKATISKKSSRGSMPCFTKLNKRVSFVNSSTNSTKPPLVPSLVFDEILLVHQQHKI